MKRSNSLLIILVILLIGFGRAASADLTPEKTRQAEALIQQFSDKQFAVRQKAVEELVAMGPDVLPLVRKTLAETKDNEVKLRCQMVIDAFVKEYGPDVGKPEVHKTVTLEGEVVDAEGKPVHGASVEAYDIRPWRWTVTSTERIWRGETEADGTFSLEVDADAAMIQVVAMKEGLAIGWDTWGEYWRDTRLTMRLGRPTGLTGIIADEAGVPVVGAKVAATLRCKGDDGTNDGVLTVGLQPLVSESDAEGRFGLKAFPSDAAAFLRVEATGRAKLTLVGPRAEGYPAGSADIRITLPAEAALEGIVLEKGTRKPVSGVTLEVQTGNMLLRFVSDENGRFRATGLSSGSCRIRVVAPPKGGAEWVAEPLVAAAESGKVTRGVTVEVTRGGIIEVVVSDSATRRRIRGARVQLQEVDRTRRFLQGRSERYGIARFRVLPGEYRLANVSKHGHSFKPSMKAASVADGEIVRVEVQLESLPKISGVVRDAAGKAVKGATVSVIPHGQGRLSTGADGRFEVVRESMYGHEGEAQPFVLVRHKKRSLAALVKVEKEEEPLEIIMTPSCTLTGWVTDPDAKPIPGARVNAMVRPGPGNVSFSVEVGTTDAQGLYSVAALPKGHQYAVWASADGYGSGESKIPVSRASRWKVGLRVVLPPAIFSVSGVVVDEFDRPVAGALVQVDQGSPQGRHQPRRTALTDADGKFVIQGVCKGSVYLERVPFRCFPCRIRRERREDCRPEASTSIEGTPGLTRLDAWPKDLDWTNGLKPAEQR